MTSGLQTADVCENCGCNIGNLETPYVHGDHVVCKACYEKLTQARAIEVTTPAVVTAVKNPQSLPTMVAPTVVSTSVVQMNSGPGTNALGITSLVIGLVSLPEAIIPGCGIVALPLAVIGLICGFIGLFMAKNVSKVSAIAGIVVCAIPICIQVVTIVIYVAASVMNNTKP
jgi:hypothetical protein